MSIVERMNALFEALALKKRGSAYVGVAKGKEGRSKGTWRGRDYEYMRRPEKLPQKVNLRAYGAEPENKVSTKSRMAKLKKYLTRKK